jgi:DNA polymerase V
MLPTNSPHSLWALIDCNNFFASCERLFRPDLIGKPVVVLSNNDGCIVARSNEAKALGIGMGEPEFKIRELLRMHDVAVFSSNYTLYGDMSMRVMRTLESIVPVVEQYSVDEAFVPLRGALAVNADAIAAEMYRRVRRWTGIGVAVGLGTTRTLAKIGSSTFSVEYPFRATQ